MIALPSRVTAGLLLLAAVAFLTTCDDDPTGPRRIHGVASVTIVPASQAVPPGDTVRLVAEVRDTGGRVISEEPVTWSSSNPSVARVDAVGLVTGVAEGSTTITATAARRRGTSAVTVSEVIINPDAVVIDSTRVRLISEDTVTGQYVFRVINGPAPELDTMSIIVGAQGDGFLRHVDGVRRQGDLVYLETSQAGLGDVVEKGAITISGPGDDSDVQVGNTHWDPARITVLHPGARLVANGIQLDDLTITLVPSPDNKGWTANARLMIHKGRLGFRSNIDGGLDYQWFKSLRKIWFTFGGTFEFDLDDYEVEISGAYNDQIGNEGRLQLVCPKWRVPTPAASQGKCGLYSDETEMFQVQRRFITFVGALPLVGIVRFNHKLVTELTFSGDVSWRGHYSAEFPLWFGVQWSGGWQNLSHASTEHESSSMTFQGADGTVSLKQSYVPEISILFYGVAGPFARADGYGKGEAMMTFPIPPYKSWDWSLGAGYGVDGTVGMRISLFKLLQKQKWMGKPKFPLDFSKTWPLLSSPFPQWRWVSEGDLPVNVATTPSSPAAPPGTPDSFRVRIRPAYESTQHGWVHSGSTQEASVGATHTFAGLPSGKSFLHQVSVPREILPGNCRVMEQNPDTFMVQSNDYEGHRDTITFTVDCLPLGDLRVGTTINGSDIPARFLVGYRRADTVGSDARSDTVWIPAAADTVLEDFVPANPANGATGEYRLSLDPGARNCAAARPDTQQVFIQSGKTVSTHFTVHCAALGQLTVTAPTADPEAASGGPASYNVSVNSTGSGSVTSGMTPLAANDTAAFTGLVPLYGATGATGGYTVTLTLPGNRCSVAGGQRLVTVFPGDTALADFPVTCVERLFVRTATTGPGRDQDGFEIRVDGQPVASIDAGATVGVAGVQPGSRTVRLAGVDDACFVSQGGVPRDSASVTVSAWDSTMVAFAVDCPAPGPPAVTARGVSASAIDVSWTLSGLANIVGQYRIYRDGVLVDSTTVNTWRDSGLPGFTPFTYGIRAVTTAGLAGPMGTATARTRDGTPPGPPASLRATALSSTAVALAWGAASDPESGITRYRISRDGNLIDSTTTTTWQDTGLAGNTTYRYDVAAVNGDGLAGPPASDTARTLDDTPPTAPTGLTAVATGPGTIDLAWAAASDVESGVTGYVIYRDGQRLTTTNLTQLQDGGLAAGTTYTYEATAVNGAGLEGPRSAPASATTPPPATTGDLEVSTTTTGVSRQHTVVVEGTGYRQVKEIAANGRALFSGLTPAPYSVILMVTGCTVTPPNPRTETVAAGQTTRTAFAVDCQPR